MTDPCLLAPLLNMIETVRPLRKTEIQLIARSFRILNVKRKAYMLQAGEQSTELIFILRGSMRMFTLNEKGHEHIVGFGLEHSWMADYKSFLLQRPSHYYIEVVEDARLLVIDARQLEKLRSSIPGFGKLMDDNNHQHLIAVQKRIHAALGLSAQQRYLDMLSHYPMWLNRFPQMMIASYLGITAETLSKMRNKLSRIRIIARPEPAL